MSNRQRMDEVGGGGAVGFSAIQLAVAAGCPAQLPVEVKALNEC
jgi:hypothetical protein